MTTPRPPVGLKAHGRALYRDISAKYTLDPAEFELLRQLSRAVDTADALAAAIAKQGVSVPGSRGQLRPNPLLNDQRETAKLIARLCTELALPIPGEGQGVRRAPAQRRQAKARLMYGR